MNLSLGKLRVYVGYEAAAALTAALLFDRGGRLVFCMLAALLHELGHLLMMLIFSVKVRSVSLRLFDVLIEADSPDGLLADVCITLGGPVMNLVLAAVFIPFGRFFGYADLALGVFNLLPVMSLDGGRLLYILLSRRLSEKATCAILCAASFLSVLPIMTAGIYILLRSGYNYSLLGISLYLLAVLLLKK